MTSISYDTGNNSITRIKDFSSTGNNSISKINLSVDVIDTNIKDIVTEFDAYLKKMINLADNIESNYKRVAKYMKEIDDAVKNRDNGDRPSATSFLHGTGR